MHTKLLALLSGLFLVLVLTACGPVTSSSERTLSVTGTGMVSLPPDLAYLSVGVHTEGSNLAKAIEQNNRQTTAVVEAIKNMGVAVEDIQTSNFSVWSTQDYDENGQRYTKYMVDNTVSITIRDLSKVGALLNEAVSAGANNINSLSFDVADKSEALSQARQKALENANALAQELAAKAGLKVGPVVSIVYSDVSPVPYYGIGSGGGAEASLNVPIEPGKLQISATVTVTYELGR
ncbi:MAG: SIMPL domain-containing protein [Anaerolineales bacterium]|nr:SIMPL domain-containing protein [Anaerolineales bacterium]MCX7607782.1 SIMPL domain-containing protein [Anaerolineales bacterium]MDW8227557.1 SIMPL domain-containing protein [Anaerolineales bacterium]